MRQFHPPQENLPFPRRAATIQMDCMVPAHAEVPPMHHPHQKRLYSLGEQPQTQAGFQTGSVVKKTEFIPYVMLGGSMPLC